MYVTSWKCGPFLSSEFPSLLWSESKDLPEELIKIQTFLLWLNILSHQTHLSIDTFVDLTLPPHCSISSSSKQKAPHFMALRCLPIWVCPQTPHRYPLVGRRVSLWECSSSPSADSQRAVTAVEGNGPELKKASDEMGLVQEAKPVAFHRDLSMLPSESTHYSVSFDTLLFHGLHIDNVDWLFCVYAIMQFEIVII